MTTTLSPIANGPADSDVFPQFSSNGSQAAESRISYMAALLMGAGLLISGVSGGTATTAPVPRSEIRFVGSWTGTGRTLEVSNRSGQTGTSSPARPNSSTSSVSDEPLSDAAAVHWLHEESGLTWDQLGRVFGVSRRAVHLWASGGRMNSTNATALREFLTVVEGLPASTAEARRSMLLAVGPDGLSVVDGFRSRQGQTTGDIQGTAFQPDQLLGALHGDVSEAL